MKNVENLLYVHCSKTTENFCYTYKKKIRRSYSSMPGFCCLKIKTNEKSHRKEVKEEGRKNCYSGSEQNNFWD